jgi:AcrR family transcriptional regulator
MAATQEHAMTDPLMPDPLAPRSGDAAGTTKSPAGAPGGRKAVIEALMRLAADRPWNDIELTDIAAEAGVSLSEMRDMFPSKGAILDGFTRMIDKQVIEGTNDDLVGEPARERVFDIIMRRLDAMAPYKAALRRISMALRSDLGSLAALNRSALNSQRYMLAAAGIPTEGPLNFIKLQGMVLTQAAVTETWFDDDDPTLARTMARIDRELRRGERIMERADDVRRLTAPLRAIGQALLDGRNRHRNRRRPVADDIDEDPAAAI